MIPLTTTDTHAQDQADLAAIIAQVENSWTELLNLEGTWFDDPSCLNPISELPEAPSSPSCVGETSKG
jgi:hypothetical protein